MVVAILLTSDAPVLSNWAAPQILCRYKQRIGRWRFPQIASGLSLCLPILLPQALVALLILPPLVICRETFPLSVGLSQVQLHQVFWIA